MEAVVKKLFYFIVLGLAFFTGLGLGKRKIRRRYSKPSQGDSEQEVLKNAGGDLCI